MQLYYSLNKDHFVCNISIIILSGYVAFSLTANIVPEFLAEVVIIMDLT